ncbi:marine proteobacterial sortase target protein [Colwellia sp. MSW7]|uniref:Marine proteobacterial sortase target protein n=1 Tax=Colwellia maritima TaxID=2912588 RepID=A0ABS9X1P5_9GAMM|nr:marine proteobacterial sortase target protein [Colwellia maritima]MCI2284165.1 marine proteobacterial sortase target protein [Colwellia maritima]
MKNINGLTHCQPSIRYNTPWKMFFLVVLITLVNLPNNVMAEEQSTQTIPYEDISSGSLYFKKERDYYAAITQKSDYQVNVNGLLAQVNFTQTFKNSSDSYVEAVYVFPLIDDASVSSMIMEIGERRIIGKIKEKQHAQQLYTKAKQQGKKVSLVSQQRPNLFTTKLANIAPGETIKISLTYMQSIRLTDETFALRIPLTLTPRYIPRERHVDRENTEEKIADTASPTKFTTSATTKINVNGWAISNARVPDANEITPYQTRITTGNPNEQLNPQQRVSLVVNLDGGIPVANITSLYHSIDETQQFNKRLITLTDKTARLDQDFVLQWQLAQGNTPKAAFFQQVDSQNEYQYGLLMLMPPKAVNEKNIKKDVIYIIDTSGSMGGVAIKQAKQSLNEALNFLNPSDTFNIIAFNTNTQHLFSESEGANSSNIDHAKHWLSTLEAGGGTNMYPAIELALKARQRESYYRQVIFITDGSVGNEAELLSLIHTNLANTRLHTIGIGSAPNGYFMSEAAKVGRGTYRYIGSINEVDEQMTQLFSQISKPLMHNIELAWPMADVEMFPNKIPDLYAGQPLLISARWLKQQNQTSIKNKNNEQTLNQLIKITGQLADKPWQENIALNIAPSVVDNSKEESNGVAQWWAKNKLDHLIRLRHRSDSRTQDVLQTQITELAIQHQLLSPFTSFIAVEEKVSRKKDQVLKKQAVKNLMPKGSTQSIPLANTALGIAQYYLIGSLLIIMAMFMQLFKTLNNKKQVS